MLHSITELELINEIKARVLCIPVVLLMIDGPLLMNTPLQLARISASASR